MKPLWKIQRDAFYGDLYAQYGLDYVERIGFFFDTNNEDVDIKDSLSVLCTPLAFLGNEPHSPSACVLLSTGSFCPIHPGHIEKMELAKKHLTENGWNVLGAYLSPGHDEYVEMKCKGHAIPIEERIALIEQQTQNISWIHIDPWEGVFNKVAVTHTDVLYRLEMYLEKHCGKKIPVFYVCGGDNARFAAGFENRGHCVVVNRPGYEEEFERYKNLGNERIYFADGYNIQSSTKLRHLGQGFASKSKKKKLVLRVNSHPLEAQLIEILSPYFESIEEKNILEQRKTFPTLTNSSCISLDAFIPAEHALHLSRRFDIFGMDQLGFVERPFCDSFDKQCEKIPLGSYALFDDDMHSGSTMRYATELLNTYGIQVSEYLSFTQTHNDTVEIADAHDFFLGGDNNGLVITLPNGHLSRAPYLYPYVNIFSRVSISAPLNFSLLVWEMNWAYYRNSPCTLSELGSQRNLFAYLGFSLSTLVSDLCEWHVKLLKAFIR